MTCAPLLLGYRLLRIGEKKITLPTVYQFVFVLIDRIIRRIVKICDS